MSASFGDSLESPGWFRALFLAGEHADNDGLDWAKKHFRVPVLDHWWQTETGWPITSHGFDLPLDYPFGTTGRPSPGWDVKILNEDHEEAKPGEMGTITVKLPLPPGAMSTVWQNEDRFIDNYFMKFKGYYDTCDAGVMDENGYVTVLGRLDDVINVAGHRLSTKQMERAIARHPDVLEQAVISMADKIKGELPVGLLVLTKDCRRPHDKIIEEVVKLVRDDVGPIAAFKTAVVLPSLPRTRSQKFLRGVLRKMLNGQSYTIPQTVENPADFSKIETIIKEKFHQ